MYRFNWIRRHAERTPDKLALVDADTGRQFNYARFFPLLAYMEQEPLASVEIVRLRPEKQSVNLSTVCTNPAGHVVCHGEALVLVSDVRGEA